MISATPGSGAEMPLSSSAAVTCRITSRNFALLNATAASLRLISESPTSPVLAFLCPPCAHQAAKTRTGPSHRLSTKLEKAQVRERRIGDLNPGRARTLTALAVRRHRPD